MAGILVKSDYLGDKEYRTVDGKEDKKQET
jgi:hypothetical protein